jgi:glycosyltransferase involved in cell wall biosynthesis
MVWTTRSSPPIKHVTRDVDHIMTIASADVPIKGLDVLIDALARLKSKGRTPRLTVVGSLRDGPTKAGAQAHRLDGSSQLRFRASQEELVDLYRRASVFVSASRFEGFGLPAAEAMACAAPVIVSDGGALCRRWQATPGL